MKPPGRWRGRTSRGIGAERGRRAVLPEVLAECPGAPGRRSWDAVGVASPSGTVTFLFTDIEGSTRLWLHGEQAMRAAVARHDQLLRSVIAEHGGTVFSTMGDGVAAAFSVASSAVAAAVAAERLLAEEAWPTVTPILVRMGLHSGEAELRDGDYFGTAVNRAARLMAVGYPGVVLSGDRRPGGGRGGAGGSGRASATGLGPYDAGVSGWPGQLRPAAVLGFAAGESPVPGYLVSGREAELAAVAKELEAGRLVTLTGVGGVGKTRLALQVAAELLPGYADGVWLCELAAAADSDDLVQVVAMAFGAAQRAQMSLSESIVDFLHTRRMLVVLDNCEHLLDAAARLAEAILATAPGVRILATSRESLGLPGEHVRPLRSLGRKRCHPCGRWASRRTD